MGVLKVVLVEFTTILLVDPVPKPTRKEAFETPLRSTISETWVSLKNIPALLANPSKKLRKARDTDEVPETVTVPRFPTTGGLRVMADREIEKAVDEPANPIRIVAFGYT